MIFEYIFEINQNPESYYDLIMLDFVHILQCRNLDIDIFFKKPMNEDEATMQNRRILNFERTLSDFSLPQYSKHKKNTQWLDTSSIFDDVREHELNGKIIELQELQGEDNQLNLDYQNTFKVEHNYINLAVTQLAMKIHRDSDFQIE